MSKVLRLPLGSNYNTRVSAVGTISTASAIAGVAVAGVAIAGTSVQPTSKDARYINWYRRTVPNEVTGENARMLVKRCGFASSATHRSGHIGNYGMVWKAQGAGTTIITAFGNATSSIYANGSRLTTDNGDTTVVSGKVTGITETLLSGTATLTISCDDNTGWYYQNAGTVTKITDAQFPGNNSKTLAGTFCHLDGYAFILDTNGDLWNSDINSITAWGANSSINAGIYPDKGVASLRWGNYIAVFGASSIEFFRNAGNRSGSPLRRVPEMAQKVGAISSSAIGEIGDNIYFVGPAPEGGLSLFQFNGQLTRVSTPELDAIFLLMGNGNILVTTFRDAGLSFVIVIGGGLSYCYCVEEKFWFQLNNAGDILWTRCFGLSVASSQATYAVSNLSSSGKLFIINPLSRTYQDNGAAYTATAQLPVISLGAGAFCEYHEVEVDADVESGTSSLTVDWTDDDYGTYSTARTLDLTTARPRTSGLGGTKNPRAFRFQHASNTPARIREARVRVTVGNS